MNALDRLTALLARLPGIGKKTAARLCYYMLDADPAYTTALVNELSGLREAIHQCSLCGNYTEIDPCPICTDPDRDRNLICVVEKPQDVRIIEEAREFRGLFFVLGGLIAPLEGIGPGDLGIDRLINRVRGEGIRELILAMNPTVEGDTTALYLQKVLVGLPVEISRLASGLPVGGDLEYTDRLTLSRSFRGRTKL
ncbi:MAG: recombination mediator RecR [Treponema sp.]|jgi:recombination protein RecR|nr:recombination mediator RecR [Treponema sp.]